MGTISCSPHRNNASNVYKANVFDQQTEKQILAWRRLLTIDEMSSAMAFGTDSGAAVFTSCVIPGKFLNLSVFQSSDGCPTPCVVGLSWGNSNRPTWQGRDPLLVQTVLIRVLLVFERRAPFGTVCWISLSTQGFNSEPGCPTTLGALGHPPSWWLPSSPISIPSVLGLRHSIILVRWPSFLLAQAASEPLHGEAFTLVPATGWMQAHCRLQHDSSRMRYILPSRHRYAVGSGGANKVTGGEGPVRSAFSSEKPAGVRPRYRCTDIYIDRMYLCTWKFGTRGKVQRNKSILQSSRFIFINIPNIY